MLLRTSCLLLYTEHQKIKVQEGKPDEKKGKQYNNTWKGCRMEEWRAVVSFSIILQNEHRKELQEAISVRSLSRLVLLC